jgi:ureidoglycolate hydrolase
MGGESSNETLRVAIEPMARAAYSPYGSLVAADDTLPFRYANMQTARRFNHLADVLNLRPDSARLNLCVFRCQPLAGLPLSVKLLEKHQFSTQVFMPTTDGARYIAIVALGDDKPDLSTLKAFEVTNPAGVSYHPGIWHYPMTVLDRQVDFACLVYEDGSEDDCEVVPLERPVEIVSRL